MTSFREKVAETFDAASKFPAIAWIYGVPLCTEITVIPCPGRRTLSAAFNIGDRLRRLESKRAVFVVDSERESQGEELKSESNWVLVGR